MDERVGGDGAGTEAETEAGVEIEAEAEAGAEVEAEAGAPGKRGPSVGVQIAAAVVLVAGVIGAFMGLAAAVDDPLTSQSSKPAVCNPPKDTDAPEYPALCAALNRPDLPTLAGLPGEHVSIAQSGGGPFTFADGTKEFDASAQVQIGSLCIEVTDNKKISIEDLGRVRGNRNPTTTTVLGHPAMTYDGRTTALSFKGGTSSAGTGGVSRHLVVQKDAAAGGGTFEFTVWRQDFATPDETTLYRVATQVLPTLQGWVAGPGAPTP
ncbi:DUF6215 domain-containing protein [Kitasatospora sp. NPDC097643]|uniref:DUF6215 domain-containing protein n=1 Tax=Kitasatospora sp. NPDC097643 TaxID=3157230 RepID=UPI0033294E7B